MNPRPRPVGVAHLVFGLIFCGIAALWLIGNANNADFPNLARGIPVVLIGAGIVGLGASTVNHRRAKVRLLARDAVDPAPADDTVDEIADEPTDQPTDQLNDTSVLNDLAEENPS